MRRGRAERGLAALGKDQVSSQAVGEKDSKKRGGERGEFVRENWNENGKTARIAQLGVECQVSTSGPVL